MRSMMSYIGIQRVTKNSPNSSPRRRVFVRYTSWGQWCHFVQPSTHINTILVMWFIHHQTHQIRCYRSVAMSFSSRSSWDAGKRTFTRYVLQQQRDTIIISCLHPTGYGYYKLYSHWITLFSSSFHCKTKTACVFTLPNCSLLPTSYALGSTST
jgi:hypothetical protein